MGRELLRNHENTGSYDQVARFDSGSSRLLTAVDRDHAPLKRAWFPYFLGSYSYLLTATPADAFPRSVINFGAVAFIFRLSRTPDAVTVAPNFSYVHSELTVGVSYSTDKSRRNRPGFPATRWEVSDEHPQAGKSTHLETMCRPRFARGSDQDLRWPGNRNGEQMERGNSGETLRAR